MPPLPDVSPYADRLLALQQRVGLGRTDASVGAQLEQLLTELDSAAGSAGAAADGYGDRPAAESARAELRWWAAATTDTLAASRMHAGDAAGAAETYRQAAGRWAALGEAARSEDSAVAAAAQAVAAGGSLDEAITGLQDALGSTPAGLAKVEVLVRLARLAADVSDHFEARRRADEASGILISLGYLDPSVDPGAAFETWLRVSGYPAPAGADDTAALRTAVTVVTAWLALLGIRGAVGDGWASGAIATLTGLSRRLTRPADDRDGGAGGDQAGAAATQLIDLARRLDALQDEYDNGPDTPNPADWQRVHDAVEQIAGEAASLQQPVLAAMARTLEADLLTWASRPADAAEVLAAARTALTTAASVPDAARRTQLIELIRRQVEIAAAAQDSAAVSRFAGEGIAEIEADRARLTLPYLQDSFLRTRRTIYSAGMAAARRLDDLQLLAERADLVKARGSLAWLPGPPATVAQVRASLAEDEAVVYHLWADRTVLYILTVDRDRVVCDRRVLTEPARADLDAVIGDFAALREAATWPDRDLPPLGELLFPTDGAAVLTGKRRLYLSPNGLLHQLPLHALNWQGRPLVESFAVSYVPNLAALTQRPAAASGAPLVVGIATFADAIALPSAEREARDVAAAYVGSDLLLGAAATRAAFDERAADGRLPAARLLHLATHGQDGPTTDPLAARLLLADGLVGGTSLSSWRLGADLVVLSACWSAQRAVVGRDGSELFGDEVYGLQSAFFAAGARQVLGSMWPADDTTTAALMRHLNQLLAAGHAGDDALRTAMLGARATDPLLYHWAPYKLTVNGRPAPG